MCCVAGCIRVTRVDSYQFRLLYRQLQLAHQVWPWKGVSSNISLYDLETIAILFNILYLIMHFTGQWLLLIFFFQLAYVSGSSTLTTHPRVSTFYHHCIIFIRRWISNNIINFVHIDFICINSTWVSSRGWNASLDCTLLLYYSTTTLPLAVLTVLSRVLWKKLYKIYLRFSLFFFRKQQMH